MSKYFHFFSVAILLASLVSCGPSSTKKSDSFSPSNSYDSSLSPSSYSVTESQDLGTCAVYQISDAFSSKAFSSVEVKPGWRFDGLPLFFESGCPLGKKALLSFAASNGLSESAESSAYGCQGTSFLSYTSRKSAEGTQLTFTINDSQQGRLAICYVARLRKQILSSGSAAISFSLYEALETPYLDCCAV
jgi:hypothetical protein